LPWTRSAERFRSTDQSAGRSAYPSTPQPPREKQRDQVRSRTGSSPAPAPRLTGRRAPQQEDRGPRRQHRGRSHRRHAPPTPASAAESSPEGTREASEIDRPVAALCSRVHRVADPADTEHLDFYLVPGREGPDAGGGPRCHEVARLERHHSRDVRQQLGNSKDHIGARSPLPLYAIDACHHRKTRENEATPVGTADWNER